MPGPFQGEIKLDVRDSTPDRQAFLTNQAPKDSPNVLVILYDDADAPTRKGTRCCEMLGNRGIRHKSR